MLEELEGMLKESYEVTRKENSLLVGSIEVYEISENTIIVDGYSSYVSLPYRFVFSDPNTALPIICPFILQALDGETRI